MMQKTNAVSILLAAGILFAPITSSAQTAPTTPQLKKIGTPTSDKPKIEPALIVMNARGATLQGQTFTLAGVAANSIIFADRPVRAAGHALTLISWRNGRQATIALERTLLTRLSLCSVRMLPQSRMQWWY